jgi:hypothetical protein
MSYSSFLNNAKNAANKATNVVNTQANNATNSLANHAKNVVIAGKNLGNLTIELSKISGAFLTGLRDIMLKSNGKPQIQQFAELIGTDFSKRLNVIMNYMNLSNNDKKEIVKNIGNILNNYALSPNNTTSVNNFSGVIPMIKSKTGGRKHKTKKNRRY